MVIYNVERVAEHENGKGFRDNCVCVCVAVFSSVKNNVAGFIITYNGDGLCEATGGLHVCMR